MKINWKERLKNKTFLISIIGLIISLVYQIVALFSDSLPKISEEAVVEIAGIAVNILAVLGVVVDPTTNGICDSERALTYGTAEDCRLKEEKSAQQST